MDETQDDIKCEPISGTDQQGILDPPSLSTTQCNSSVRRRRIALTVHDRDAAHEPISCNEDTTGWLPRIVLHRCLY